MKVVQLEISSTGTGYVLGRKKTSARMQATRLLICTWLLFIAFSPDATTGCQPKTTSNQCCAIPFKYHGSWYYSCTTANHHSAWCSLNRVYRGHWGNCVTTSCQPKTTSNQCCAIPFLYRGWWYYSCTTDNHHSAWCSLDRLYLGRWGNCQ